MELVAPAGPVYQAGTLSGNPLAMTAGLWSLTRAVAEALPAPAELGAQLAAGLADAAREAGVPLQVNAFGSLLTPFFTSAAGARLPVGARRRTPPPTAAFFRGDAGARRLSAAVAVRSVVPVGRAHARSDVDETIKAAPAGDEGGRSRYLSGYPSGVIEADAQDRTRPAA